MRSKRMKFATERMILQAAVMTAGLVPVTAGLGGIFLGENFVRLNGPPSALTHASYLSGLLLGIGIAFWTAVPQIEKHRSRFIVLTLIVFAGGLARGFTSLTLGAFAPIVWFALIMELLVTPALCLWQNRIARLSGA